MIIENPIILDNVIPEKYQSEIEHTLTQIEFDWHLNKSVSYGASDITKKFIGNEVENTKLLIRNNILLSLAMTIILFVCFLIVEKYLYVYWVDKQYSFGNLTIVSLLIWLFSNSIQHIAGTVLVSIGGAFKKLFNISLVIVINMLIFSLLILLIFNDLEKYLFINSIIYFFGTIFYLLTLFKVLNERIKS